MRLSLKLSAVLALIIVEFYPILSGKIPLPIGKANQFPVYESALPLEDRQDASADIGDLITQFYPWHAFAGESVRRGTLPLWNPHILGGTPFEAAQSGLFYPPNAVFYILPAPWAWTLMIVLQTILPGLFTALYVRSIIGNGWSAAGAGVVFSFCGFMTGWRGFAIVDAALWLPVILWCLEHLRLEVSMRWLAFTSAALAMPLLAAHPETAAHVYLVAGAYVLFRIGSVGRMRFSLMFAAAVLLAIGLAAIQVLPTLEWISYVPRSIDQEWPGRPHHERIAVLSRDMSSSPNAENIHIPEGAAYAGILTLLLAAWSAFDRERRPTAFFWVGCVLVSAAVVYEIQPIYALFGDLPLIGGIKNNRMLLVLDFGLAILAGLGISGAIRTASDEHYRRHTVSRWMALIIPAAVCLYFINSIPRPLVAIVFLLAGFFIIALRSTGWIAGRAFGAACVGLIAVDLMTATHHYVPYYPVHSVFPPASTFQFLQEKTRGGHRVVGAGMPYAYNAEMMYGLSTVGGVDIPLVRTRRFFFDYIQDNENGFTFLPNKLATLRDRRIDLMDVRYIVAGMGEPHEALESQPERFVAVFQDQGVRVFENRSAMERAFFIPATSVQVISDELSALERLRDPSFDPALSVILAEPLQPAAAAAANVSTRIYDFIQTTNEIRVNADASEAGVLVVSEMNFAGWKAEVDGKPSPLLLADYALIGVPLDQGPHSVRLRYSPVSFRTGLIISLISLVLLVILWSARAVRIR